LNNIVLRIAEGGEPAVGICFGVDPDRDPGRAELIYHTVEVGNSEVDGPGLDRPAEVLGVDGHG
jgi:hypothetical protein